MFHQIKNTSTGETIFQGEFGSTKSCVEEAIKIGLSLDFADLSGSCLINANMDGGSFRHTCFKGANLMGANLSDAVFDHADFTNSSLQNCCLCFSSIKNVDFTGALFGGTDITGCDISYSRFSTLSALMLNFVDSKSMEGCCYIHCDGISCPFSRPVIAINGLAQPITVFDQHLKIGSRIVQRNCSFDNDVLPRLNQLTTTLYRIENLLLRLPLLSHKEAVDH